MIFGYMQTNAIAIAIAFAIASSETSGDTETMLILKNLS